MRVPEAEGVVAVPGHAIEELAPELEIPHLGDVGLGGVASVLIRWIANIEGNVEFQTTTSDVGFVYGAFERIERAYADGFLDVEAAIHGSGFISADDADLISVALDAVALRSGLGLLFDGESNLRGGVFGIGCTLDLGGSKFAGAAGAGVVGELERGSRGKAVKKMDGKKKSR